MRCLQLGADLVQQLQHDCRRVQRDMTERKIVLVSRKYKGVSLITSLVAIMLKSEIFVGIPVAQRAREEGASSCPFFPITSV